MLKGSRIDADIIQHSQVKHVTLNVDSALVDAMNPSKMPYPSITLFLNHQACPSSDPGDSNVLKRTFILDSPLDESRPSTCFVPLEETACKRAVCMAIFRCNESNIVPT